MVMPPPNTISLPPELTVVLSALPPDDTFITSPEPRVKSTNITPELTLKVVIARCQPVRLGRCRPAPKPPQPSREGRRHLS
jgi:hypothetical protein